MFKIRQNLSVCSHTFKFEPAERQRLKKLNKHSTNKNLNKECLWHPVLLICGTTQKLLPLCLAILPT